jgi:hypothetical protein
MMEKAVSAVLVLVLINVVCVRFAHAQTDKDAQRFSQIKHEVEKLGFDEQVDVRLQNGATLKGRISGIADDQFVITDKQGTATKVPYTSARRVVKSNGSTRSQLGLFALGVGGLAGMIALIVVVGRKDSVTR